MSPLKGGTTLAVSLASVKLNSRFSDFGICLNALKSLVQVLEGETCADESLLRI